MCRKFIVIGIPDDHRFVHDEQTVRLIHENRVFSGGKRHHELMKPYLPEPCKWIDIAVPIDDVFAQYALVEEPIVVFVSGDPLFFGFAVTIRRKLPDAEITVFPYFNSLQMLAHRLVMPYHDMHIVSLTGRPWHEFDAALIRLCLKIGVLTDGTHTPGVIARRMLDFGYTYYNMSVGEHLGNPEQERVTTMELTDAAERDFSQPNCVIIERKRMPESVRFPIPDALFEHLDGREKMITKAPIRLLTLAALELNAKSSFWDIGFCTGSVSIEAKLHFPQLQVTAFEIREDGQRLMNVNSRRFHAPGIEAVIGDFLQQDISRFPQPDAVFIGGHGGQLKAIIAKVLTVLRDDGVIVFNSVTSPVVSQLTSRKSSRQLWDEACTEFTLHQDPPLRIQLNDYNPIEILKARK